MLDTWNEIYSKGCTIHFLSTMGGGCQLGNLSATAFRPHCEDGSVNFWDGFVSPPLWGNHADCHLFFFLKMLKFGSTFGNAFQRTIWFASYTNLLKFQYIRGFELNRFSIKQQYEVFGRARADISIFLLKTTF